MSPAGGALPGNQVFIDKMAKMLARAADPAPLWEAMIVNFHQIEEAKFSSGGPGWAELQPSTLAVKAALGFAGTNILERTGDLWGSMTGTNGFTDKRVSVYGWYSGTTLPYAGFHQTGTPPRMVAREIVNITPGVVAMWSEMMRNYFFAGGSEGRMPGTATISKAI